MLVRTQLPKDDVDQWQTPSYARYMENLGWKAVGIPGSYGYARTVGPFVLVKYILTDTEPSLDEVRAKTGSRHGLIYWSPRRKTEIPRYWRRSAKDLFLHDWRQGFSVVRSEYQDTWSSRASRNLKSFFSRGAHVRPGTVQEYCSALPMSLLPKSLRGLILAKLKKFDPLALRVFLVEYSGEIVGGLCTLPYNISSTHISSFLTPTGKEINAGTGCIDAWYQDALKNGITYLHFGGVWGQRDPKEWQGFSEFKRNFIDYEVEFESAYWRWF